MCTIARPARGFRICSAQRAQPVTNLPQEVVDEWPLIHMVQRAAATQYDFDRVARTLVPPAEAE